jgi:hypothetical protein
MPCVFTGAACLLAGRERRSGGAGQRARQEGHLISPSKKKESGSFSALFLFCGASSPPGTWRSSRQPRCGRATASEGSGRYLRSRRCCPGRPRQSCTLFGGWRRGLDRSRRRTWELRHQRTATVVEEMRGDAVDRQPPKHNARVELSEKSIFQRFRVRVGRDYFAEKLFGGALRLLVVCVRHRVYKPSLSV